MMRRLIAGITALSIATCQIPTAPPSGEIAMLIVWPTPPPSDIGTIAIQIH